MGFMWCAAINLKLRALEENRTWQITSLPSKGKQSGANGYLEPNSSMMVLLRDILQAKMWY